MSKSIIAVDIDDVLAATTLAVIAHAAELLQKEMRIGNIKSIDYWLEYGVADHEAIALVQGYNVAGFPGLEPVDGAVEAVQRLAKVFEIHAITARDERVKIATEEWLTTYFSGCIKTVHFVGNKFVSSSIKTKSSVCNQLGARVAIDDDAEHISDYTNSSMEALVYGDYPWVDYEEMPSKARRCKDWIAVSEYFEKELDR